MLQTVRKKTLNHSYSRHFKKKKERRIKPWRPTSEDSGPTVFLWLQLNVSKKSEEVRELARRWKMCLIEYFINEKLPYGCSETQSPSVCVFVFPCVYLVQSHSFNCPVGPFQPYAAFLKKSWGGGGQLLILNWQIIKEASWYQSTFEAKTLKEQLTFTVFLWDLAIWMQIREWKWVCLRALQRYCSVTLVQLRISYFWLKVPSDVAQDFRIPSWEKTNKTGGFVKNQFHSTNVFVRLPNQA